MSKSRTLPQATFMEIDAKLATEYLKKERKSEPGVKGTNRKISINVVDEYAAAMLRGEWDLTHQGIAFSDEDHMIDGGHRLRAVIAADQEKPGITVPFMVTFGIPEESMLAMDIGRRRVPADFLAMAGESNVTALSGILRLAYCYYNVPWVHTETWTRHRITPTMQNDFLAANPSLRESVYETFPLKKLFKPSAGGAFHFITTKERPDVDVQDFLYQLRSGELLAKGDPALTLRELMLNSKAALRRFTATEELALMIKAFNRWAKQEESHLLAFRSGEQFPRVYVP